MIFIGALLLFKINLSYQFSPLLAHPVSFILAYGNCICKKHCSVTGSCVILLIYVLNVIELYTFSFKLYLMKCYRYPSNHIVILT
jgi:hypothetical protein